MQVDAVLEECSDGSVVLVVADGKHTILALLPKNLKASLTDSVTGPIGAIGELLHASVIINASFHTCLHVPHVNGSSPPPACNSLPQRMRREPDFSLAIQAIQYETSLSCRIGTPQPIGLCDDILKYICTGRNTAPVDIISTATLYKIAPRLQELDRWLTPQLFCPTEMTVVDAGKSHTTQQILGMPWKTQDLVIGKEQLAQMRAASSQLREMINPGGRGGEGGGSTTGGTEISRGTKIAMVTSDSEKDCDSQQHISPYVLSVEVADDDELPTTSVSEQKGQNEEDKRAKMSIIKASVLKRISLSGSERGEISSNSSSRGDDESWRNYDEAQMAQPRDIEVDNVVQSAESLVAKSRSRKRKAVNDIQHEKIYLMIDEPSLSQ